MGEYTRNWTDCKKDEWKVLDEFKDKPAKALEIGTFEGRTAVWFLENILTHKESTLLCIDPYSYKGNRDELSTVQLNRAKQLVAQNLLPFIGKVTLCQERSDTVLPKLAKDTRFDFVYIDGSHEAVSCLYDLVAVYPFLNVGGIIIVDDVSDNIIENQHWGTNNPWEAVKKFQLLPHIHSTLLWRGMTAGIRKLAPVKVSISENQDQFGIAITGTQETPKDSTVKSRTAVDLHLKAKGYQ